MPLPNFNHQEISVSVAPKTTAAGAVLFTQRAVFDELRVRGAARGPLSLELATVPVFATASGDAVPDDLGLLPTPTLLTADNNCAVYYNEANAADPRNGQPLYFRYGVAPNEWGSLSAAGQFTPLVGGLAATPEPLRLQGDWAETLLFALLAPLIRSNMEAANQPPFSRY